MNFRLWYNLRKTRNSLSPRAGFKRELAAALSERFDTIHGRPSVWHRYIWIRTTRIILASTVGFSMVGTSAYAYNSADVTEGSLLYPVKIGIEKVEEKTKTSTEQKVKFLIKQADRRDAEREVLVKKFKTKVEVDDKKIDVIVVEVPVISTTSSVAASSVSSTVATSTKTEEREINVEKENESVKTVRRIKSEKRSVESEKKIREKFNEEVKKTEEKIESVEQKLVEVQSKLGDDEEGKKIRKIIEERLEKKREKEREKEQFEREREENKEEEKDERRTENEQEDRSGESENRDSND